MLIDVLTKSIVAVEGRTMDKSYHMFLPADKTGHTIMSMAIVSQQQSTSPLFFAQPCLFCCWGVSIAQFTAA